MSPDRSELIRVYRIIVRRGPEVVFHGGEPVTLALDRAKRIYEFAKKRLVELEAA